MGSVHRHEAGCQELMELLPASAWVWQSWPLLATRGAKLGSRWGEGLLLRELRETRQR